jgi:hypothetical protein
MELVSGSRWKSTVCDTEVIVVRAADGARTLGCGGSDMVPVDGDGSGGTIDPALSGGTLVGKRYGDEASGLEVLCTKGGAGTLTLDGEALPVKGAKPLPSSD